MFSLLFPANIKMINKRSPIQNKIVACNLSTCTVQDKTIDICAQVGLQAVTINISLRDISDFKLIEELHWLGNLKRLMKLDVEPLHICRYM